MNSLPREQLIRLKNILKGLGIDDKEVDVYRALLSMGTGVVSAISKTSGLPRTTLYFILERLQKKGFVTAVEHGKVKHYTAQPPEAVLASVQEKKHSLSQLEHQLKDVLPLLQSAVQRAPATTPKVSVLHGLESVKPVYREILQGEFWGMLNPEVMYQEFGMTMAELLFGPGLKLKGRDLLVDNEFTRKHMKDLPHSEQYNFRILPKTVNFACDVLIWKNKLGLFSYDKQHTSIIIENDRIIEMIKQWYEVLWLASTPTDQL